MLENRQRGEDCKAKDVLLGPRQLVASSLRHGAVRFAPQIARTSIIQKLAQRITVCEQAGPFSHAASSSNLSFAPHCTLCVISYPFALAVPRMPSCLRCCQGSWSHRHIEVVQNSRRVAFVGAPPNAHFIISSLPCADPAMYCTPENSSSYPSSPNSRICSSQCHSSSAFEHTYIYFILLLKLG